MKLPIRRLATRAATIPLTAQNILVHVAVRNSDLGASPSEGQGEDGRFLFSIVNTLEIIILGSVTIYRPVTRIALSSFMGAVIRTDYHRRLRADCIAVDEVHAEVERCFWGCLAEESLGDGFDMVKDRIQTRGPLSG
jgi:hypothetical protein